MKIIDIIIDFEKTPLSYSPLLFSIEPLTSRILSVHKSNPFWFPVWFNRKKIEKGGVKVRFQNFRNLRINKLSSLIGIDSRVFDIEDKKLEIWWKKNWTELYTLNFLKKLKKLGKLIVWFDTSDSTGTTQFHVLKFVEKYYKRQLLKDYSLYKQNFALGRYYTDYYSKKYKIEPEFDTYFYPLEQKEEKKIGLSWNFALNDYRPIQKIGPFIKYLPLSFKKPSKERKILLSARFSTKYRSKLVQFQRIKLLEFIKTKIPPSELGIGSCFTRA